MTDTPSSYKRTLSLAIVKAKILAPILWKGYLNNQKKYFLSIQSRIIQLLVQPVWKSLGSDWSPYIVHRLKRRL